MDTIDKIDMLLQEVHGRGMAQFLKVKDDKKAAALLKKKGIKWSMTKDGSMAVGEDDFDTAEEALLRANILRF
jgi:hypothetical protein